MKTSVNIFDALHEEARKIAGIEKTTVKDLIEEGLRRVISERKRKISFHLRKATFNGKATGPMVHDARIAALCLLHGVTELRPADRDFSRFPSLKVRNPLVG